MAKYRNTLPQLGGGLYLTDGGIETTLIFHEGLDLPDFAAFHLLKTHEGEAALRKYFRTYAEIAKQFGTGLILESATWRANADWGTRLGYTPEVLADANRRAIHLLEEVRNEYETERTPVVISGCLGPRGDGYVPDRAMSEQEAAAYHRDQVETLAGSAADMVCAITMNYVEESLGIARVAQRAGMPVAISFTVETDGNLPTGQTLKAAIEQVDDATSGYPCYYMINCAHPAHFEHVLAEGGLWLDRIRGPPSERFAQESRRAERVPRARCWEPRRTGIAVRPSQDTTPAPECDGWVLWHGPPPCGTDRRSLLAAFSRCDLTTACRATRA